MTNPVYALCIGVSDYRTFAPDGHLDLPGANDDANRWNRILRTQFALPADQIRQLSGIDQAADTDRAAIVAGLQWLGQCMAKAPDSSGLLTFSGHGLTLAQGGGKVLEEGTTLALAPSDIDAGLTQAITFIQIEETIFDALGSALFGSAWGPTADQRAAVEARMENISAVIDACYSRPQVPVGTVRCLTPAKQVPSLPDPPPRIFARLSLACQLWETAYEIKTAGNWHGAFTYALTSMLEQWAMGSDEQTAVSYSQASYGDLIFRARTLVNTLGLQDQNPALVGSVTNLPLLPFLRPGRALERGWTSVQPNGVRRREEFSAGQGTQLYQEYYLVFSADNGTVTLPVAYMTMMQIQLPVHQGQQVKDVWYWYASNAASLVSANPTTTTLTWTLSFSTTVPAAGASQVGTDSAVQGLNSFSSVPAYYPPDAGATSNNVWNSQCIGPQTQPTPAWAVRFQWNYSTGSVMEISVFANSATYPSFGNLLPSNLPSATTDIAGTIQTAVSSPPSGWSVCNVPLQ